MLIDKHPCNVTIRTPRDNKQEVKGHTGIETEIGRYTYVSMVTSGES